MATKYITDNGGKTLKIVEFEGHKYPAFNIESLKHATKIKARPDDLVIITYPKAGTHWMFEITRFLMAGSVDLPCLEKDDYMIEDACPDFIDNVPSPRNLNTHYHADVISYDFMAQRSKIIYVTRDPRDILISFFNHHRKLTKYYEYAGEFKDYFHLFLEGKVDYDSWFQYTKSWEKVIKDHPHNPILVLSYEDMKLNPLDSIKKISEFLGCEHGDAFLKQVVDKTNFDAMSKKRNVEGNEISSIMYRKGISGDWKNWFTVAQCEQFNDVFEREMRGTEAYKLYSHTVQGQADSNMNTVG